MGLSQENFRPETVQRLVFGMHPPSAAGIDQLRSFSDKNSTSIFFSEVERWVPFPSSSAALVFDNNGDDDGAMHRKSTLRVKSSGKCHQRRCCTKEKARR